MQNTNVQDSYNKVINQANKDLDFFIRNIQADGIPLENIKVITTPDSVTGRDYVLTKHVEGKLVSDRHIGRSFDLLFGNGSIQKSIVERDHNSFSFSYSHKNDLEKALFERMALQYGSLNLIISGQYRILGNSVNVEKVQQFYEEIKAIDVKLRMLPDMDRTIRMILKDDPNMFKSEEKN